MEQEEINTLELYFNEETDNKIFKLKHKNHAIKYRDSFLCVWCFSHSCGPERYFKRSKNWKKYRKTQYKLKNKKV